MNLFGETLAWLAQNFASGELWVRIGEQLFYTVISVLIASAIAIPVGYLIGHTGKGREIAVGIAGAARALPSFGLMLLLISLVGVVQRPSPPSPRSSSSRSPRSSPERTRASRRSIAARSTRRARSA